MGLLEVILEQLLSVITWHILDIWAPFGATIWLSVAKFLLEFRQFTLELRLELAFEQRTTGY